MAQLTVLVPQSRPTLCNAVDCSLPGSSVHWILKARILKGVAVLFSRGSSLPRHWSQVLCIGIWVLCFSLCVSLSLERSFSHQPDLGYGSFLRAEPNHMDRIGREDFLSKGWRNENETHGKKFMHWVSLDSLFWRHWPRTAHVTNDGWWLAWVYILAQWYVTLVSYLTCLYSSFFIYGDYMKIK